MTFSYSLNTNTNQHANTRTRTHTCTQSTKIHTHAFVTILHIPQHIASHCNTLVTIIYTYPNSLQLTATHCNTLVTIIYMYPNMNDLRYTPAHTRRYHSRKPPTEQLLPGQLLLREFGTCLTWNPDVYSNMIHDTLMLDSNMIHETPTTKCTQGTVRSTPSPRTPSLRTPSTRTTSPSTKCTQGRVHGTTSPRTPSTRTNSLSTNSTLQTKEIHNERVTESPYRVAKTHRMPYLYRSFSAKEPCDEWRFCGK